MSDALPDEKEVCEFCHGTGVIISDDEEWRGEPRKLREPCMCQDEDEPIDDATRYALGAM
jgi:hypothetical protein